MRPEEQQSQEQPVSDEQPQVNPEDEINRELDEFDRYVEYQSIYDQLKELDTKIDILISISNKLNLPDLSIMKIRLKTIIHNYTSYDTNMMGLLIDALVNQVGDLTIRIEKLMKEQDNRKEKLGDKNGNNIK